MEGKIPPGKLIRYRPLSVPASNDNVKKKDLSHIFASRTLLLLVSLYILGFGYIFLWTMTSLGFMEIFFEAINVPSDLILRWNNFFN